MRRSLFALVLALGVALGAALAPRPALGGAFAPSTPSWSVVIKGADETRASNSTITADSALTWTAAANAEYAVLLHIDYRNLDAARDLQYSITGPASPSQVRLKRSYWGGSNTAIKIAHWNAYPDPETFGDGGAYNQVRLEGVIHNGANAGAVTFAWAQDASDGDGTTVLAGSYWQYRRADP